jgi:dTDP-4-amino-4,6-dideoxygalactose transaminase
LGIHQLKKVNKFLELRKRYTEVYDDAFKNIPELEILIRKDDVQSAYHLYIIALRLDRLTIDRDQFLHEIQTRGIGVAVHYVALHLQPYYREQFKTKAEDCPVASSYSERILTLPLYPKMSTQDVARVIETVTDLIKKYRR